MKTGNRNDRDSKKVSKSVENNSIIDRFNKKKSTTKHGKTTVVDNTNNNSSNHHSNHQQRFQKVAKKKPITESTLSQEDRDLLKRKKDIQYLEENKTLTGSQNSNNVSLLKKANLKSKINENLLMDLTNTIRKTTESVKCYRDRSMILKRLEDIKYSHSLSSYGLITFTIFGSSSIQLALKESDIDIVMTMEKELKSVSCMKNWIYKFASVLRSYGFEQVQPIPFAKVPIVRCYDPKTNFKCDITLTQDSGNTRVVKEFCSLNPLLPTLIIFVKNWASKMNINDASLGTLSSYSITNMLIYILQLKNKLPSYKNLSENKNHNNNNNNNTNNKNNNNNSKTELAEILIYFFQYFGFIFNYRYNMINIYDFKEQDEKEMPDKDDEERFKNHRSNETSRSLSTPVNIKIQDTKDLFFIKDCIQSHNITRCVQRDKLFKIIKEFQKAYTQLISGKLPY